MQGRAQPPCAPPHSPLYREDDTPIDLPAEGEGLPELLEADELKQALYEEMLGLDEPFRQALLLRSVYQLSYERIAAETETDIGTVKSRIFRGRERIRKI